jgi:hypothetical protein
VQHAVRLCEQEIMDKALSLRTACFVREQVGEAEARTVFRANSIRLQPGYVSTSRMAVARPTMLPPITQ